jgi:hypothetical protein
MLSCPLSRTQLSTANVNNVGSTTLFNPVKQQAHNFYACMN